MNKYFKIAALMLSFLWFSQEGIAQCFPTQIVTAAYATGGTSPYKDKVLWLTWGSTNQVTYPYGRHDRPLGVGSKSYASIHLGGDMYLCIEAEITAISGGAVNSYAPGNYSGDSLDKLYNIGGIASANQLVAGIINRVDNTTSTITLKAKATINGDPIRIAGLVVADGESLAPNEYIYSTARGIWNVVDVRKNTSAGTYNISKNNPTGTSQEIRFERGNNANTGAVAFLDFNDTAYGAGDFSVNFTTTLKGGGKTALAIGLLTPNADLGDAPESYGTPIHLIQNLNVTADGIIPGATNPTNINLMSYNPGQLLVFEGKHLGTKAPDADNGPMHSSNALGDDISPLGNPLIDEEDAWPLAYRRFSYKANYMPGNTIEATIAYKNAQVGDKISGWIDFNLNGTFDEDGFERKTATITTAGNGTVSLIWTVPATRVPYNTYVRLRYFDSSEDATSPIGNVNFGEVEDHRMYILTPGMTNPMLPSKSKIEEP